MCCLPSIRSLPGRKPIAALARITAPTVHTAIRDHDPGEVQIWDMLTPETAPEEDDWRKPVDSLPAPPVRLAEQIARTIDLWLKNGEIIDGTRPPARGARHHGSGAQA